MFKNKKFLVSLFAIMLFASSLKSAKAIEYGMLGGKPAYPDANVENGNAWFIYNLKPGEFKEDGIMVMNLFDSPLDVSVYASDGVKSSGGGFALKQMSEQNTEVGSWVKFYPDAPPEFFKDYFEKNDKSILGLCKKSREDLQKDFEKKNIGDDDFSALEEWCKGKDLVEKKFAAKEKNIIPFVFSVPDGTEIGEHTGGILVQKKATDETNDASGSAVKLTTRVGVRIYETVPGQIVRQMKIESFSLLKSFDEFGLADLFGAEKKPREYTVQTKVSNQGNVSIEHENNVQVRDLLFGRKSEDINRKFQVLRGDDFIANYSWKKPFFGYYSFQAEVKYKDQDGKEDVLRSDVVKKWIIPWREIAFVLLLVALGFFAYWLWKRNYNKKYGGNGWVEYKVGKGEDMAYLSKKFGTDWKVFVKTNKLKPPYHLEEGQTIKVPSMDATGKATTEIISEAAVEMEPEKNEKKRRGRKPKPKNLEEEPKIKVKAASKKARIVLKEVLIEDDIVREASGKKWIFVAAAAILGAAALVLIAWAGIIVFKNQKAEKTINQKISISALGGEESNKVVENKNDTVNIPQEEVKSEQKSVLDPLQMKIKVLNGGAQAGMAGKIKTIITEKGYVNVEAKNAQKEDNVGTVVYYSSVELEKYANDLVVVLGDKKVKATAMQASSEEQKEGDVVIVLGK